MTGREDSPSVVQLETALHVATLCHKGQRDKGGKPYILHPLRVMMQMDTPELQILAVLHDVLEDTHMTAEELVSMGIDEHLVQILEERLTRREGQSYTQYLDYLSDDDLARRVKIADMRDNMRVERLPELTQRELKRLEKYHAGLRVLLRQEWLVGQDFHLDGQKK